MWRNCTNSAALLTRHKRPLVTQQSSVSNFYRRHIKISPSRFLPRHDTNRYCPQLIHKMKFYKSLLCNNLVFELEKATSSIISVCIVNTEKSAHKAFSFRYLSSVSKDAHTLNLQADY